MEKTHEVKQSDTIWAHIRGITAYFDFYIKESGTRAKIFLRFPLWSSNGRFHGDPRTMPRLSENWYFVWRENPARTNNIFLELSYRATIREGFIIASIGRLSSFLQDISRGISKESTAIIKFDIWSDVECVNILKFIAALARLHHFWIYVSSNRISNQIFLEMKYVSCIVWKRIPI